MKTLSLIEELANVAHYSQQYRQAISKQSSKIKEAVINKNLNAFKEIIGNDNTLQFATAQQFFHL